MSKGLNDNSEYDEHIEDNYYRELDKIKEALIKQTLALFNSYKGKLKYTELYNFGENNKEADEDIIELESYRTKRNDPNDIYISGDFNFMYRLNKESIKVLQPLINNMKSK